MKKSTALTLFAVCAALLAGTTQAQTSASQSQIVAPEHNVQLKTFLAHPTYCKIFTGTDSEPDAMTMSYSQAVAALIPNGTPHSGVKDVLTDIQAACAAKLLTVSDGFSEPSENR